MTGLPSTERLLGSRLRRVDPDLLLIAALLLGLVLLGSIALSVGRFPVPLATVWRILLSHVVPLEPSWTLSEQRVVELSRAPRVLLAMFIGGGLALSGATLQGVFRNPLVSAQILGVSSGASFGGALMILLGLGWAALVGGAMASGLLALVAVFLLGRARGQGTVLMIVLAGTVTGAFFSALVSFLTYIADPNSGLPAIVFWLLGSLATATYTKVAVAAITGGIGSAVILALRWQLNVLSLGDEDASALGIKPDRIRWALLVAVAGIVAGAVAVSGVIGWVGLVVPHAVRMLTGADHRRLLPLTLLSGAAFLTLMDTVARTLSAREIPVGILTALLGAPIFFLLLWQTRGRGWSGD